MIINVFLPCISVSSHRLWCQFVGCIVTPYNFWSVVRVLEEAARFYQDNCKKVTSQQSICQRINDNRSQPLETTNIFVQASGSVAGVSLLCFSARLRMTGFALALALLPCLWPRSIKHRPDEAYSSRVVPDADRTRPKDGVQKL
jgi:hypothetical protein